MKPSSLAARTAGASLGSVHVRSAGGTGGGGGGGFWQRPSFQVQSTLLEVHLPCCLMLAQGGGSGGGGETQLPLVLCARSSLVS